VKPLRINDVTDAKPLNRRGHRLPATLDAINRRDQLICEAVATHFPGASANDAAHGLHQALDRYAGGPWRRERTAEACPPRHAGRLAGYCWQILRARDRTPSARLIRLILSREAFRCQLSGR
jgi:hypothetical protein